MSNYHPLIFILVSFNTLIAFVCFYLSLQKRSQLEKLERKFDTLEQKVVRYLELLDKENARLKQKLAKTTRKEFLF